MNHLNLNFEGRSLSDICNIPEADIRSPHTGITELVKEGIVDICENIHDYQFDCDKCAIPHKSMHRGKVLQRLLRDASNHNEQLLVFGSLEFIMDIIHERTSGVNDLEKLLLSALKNSKLHQA